MPKLVNILSKTLTKDLTHHMKTQCGNMDSVFILTRYKSRQIGICGINQKVYPSGKEASGLHFSD